MRSEPQLPPQLPLLDESLADQKPSRHQREGVQNPRHEIKTPCSGANEIKTLYKRTRRKFFPCLVLVIFPEQVIQRGKLLPGPRIRRIFGCPFGKADAHSGNQRHSSRLRVHNQAFYPFESGFWLGPFRLSQIGLRVSHVPFSSLSYSRMYRSLIKTSQGQVVA